MSDKKKAKSPGFVTQKEHDKIVAALVEAIQENEALKRELSGVKEEYDHLVMDMKRIEEHVVNTLKEHRQ